MFITQRVKNFYFQKGVTLIELVLSMVIIAISLTGVLLTINLIVIDSSDPLLRQQAIYLAQAQLNKVMNLPFLDPLTSTACPIAPCCTGIACPGPAACPMNYVCAYNGYSTTPPAQWMKLGSDLSNYTISVAVADNASFGGIPNSTNSASPPGTNLLQVTVTVTDGTGTTSPVQLTAYRTNY